MRLQLQPAGRFNERLVLSLASNRACILMDDELNILPTSSHVQSITPLPTAPDGATTNGPTAELKELVDSLADTQVSRLSLITATYVAGASC